jgi:hypothetical protein
MENYEIELEEKLRRFCMTLEEEKVDDALNAIIKLFKEDLHININQKLIPLCVGLANKLTLKQGVYLIEHLDNQFLFGTTDKQSGNVIKDVYLEIDNWLSEQEVVKDEQ